jgi:hypothetical protein
MSRGRRPRRRASWSAPRYPGRRVLPASAVRGAVAELAPAQAAELEELELAPVAVLREK